MHSLVALSESMGSPADGTLWERFIASKLTQTSEAVAAEHEGSSSHLSGGSMLNLRSPNLTAGSIALHADTETAALMRELAVKPTSELFSAKASRELAARGRFVDFVKAVMSCAALSNSSKKGEVAIRCIEVKMSAWLDPKRYDVRESIVGHGVPVQLYNKGWIT